MEVKAEGAGKAAETTAETTAKIEKVEEVEFFSSKSEIIYQNKACIKYFYIRLLKFMF